MVLFSLGFWYAFSSTEYGSKVKPDKQPLPLWKAALHALNPWDIIVGMVRIFPLCGELSRSGDWKEYRRAVREQGIQGAVRKGVRKYKNRKGQSQGRYQELDDGTESLTKPTEIHARSESDDLGSYPMSGGLGGAEMYQPPAGSPLDEDRSYLMGDMDAFGRPRASSQGYLAAEQAAPGRLRASSQSSLMAESQPQAGRPRSPSAGQWNGQRYDRTPSPAEGGRFVEVLTQGRDMV